MEGHATSNEDADDQPEGLRIVDEEDEAPLAALVHGETAAMVPESVVSAAEGLSSLQASPVTAPPRSAAKRKRKEGTPVKGRSAPRRKTKREQAAVTVRDHKISLDEASGASLYKLTRLWMDDGTHAINQPSIAPIIPNGGLMLPPPEPHNAQSATKRPARPPTTSAQDFEKAISPDSPDDETTIELLKEGYVNYAKVLRTWFCVQRAHRLKRYTERWKQLAIASTRPPQP